MTVDGYVFTEWGKTTIGDIRAWCETEKCYAEVCRPLKSSQEPKAVLCFDEFGNPTQPTDERRFDAAFGIAYDQLFPGLPPLMVHGVAFEHLGPGRRYRSGEIYLWQNEQPDAWAGTWCVKINGNENDFNDSPEAALHELYIDAVKWEPVLSALARLGIGGGK